MSTTKKKTKTKRAKKRIIPKGYDSRLEYDLHNNELIGWDHHPQEKVEYVTKHSYEPDFQTEVCLQHPCRCTKHRRCGPSKTIMVEVKGRFRTSAEARKYIGVREALEGTSSKQEEVSQEKELIFFFQDADKPMPAAKRRKDGTKHTHGAWAEKHGFRYFCLKEGLPKQWLTSLI